MVARNSPASVRVERNFEGGTMKQCCRKNEALNKSDAFGLKWRCLYFLDVFPGLAGIKSYVHSLCDMMMMMMVVVMVVMVVVVVVVVVM